MEFLEGTLTAAATLRAVSEPADTLEFPAGTTVSVARFRDEPDPTRYHLNARGPGGQWDTYEGYAPAADVELGAIIATCN